MGNALMHVSFSFYWRHTTSLLYAIPCLAHDCILRYGVIAPIAVKRESFQSPALRLYSNRLNGTSQIEQLVYIYMPFAIDHTGCLAQTNFNLRGDIIFEWK